MKTVHAYGVCLVVAVFALANAACSSGSSPGVDTSGPDVADTVQNDVADTGADDVADVRDSMSQDTDTSTTDTNGDDAVDNGQTDGNQGDLVKPCAGPAECDDENPCTIDDCVNETCENQLKVCNDEDGCTADSCDPLTGACVFAAVPGCGNACSGPEECNDSNACTLDQCVDNQCVNSELSCDDLDPCTEDYCYPEAGCIHSEVPECVPPPCETAESCNDDLICTVDSCNSETKQCEHFQVVCEDSDPCTVDSCVEGTGCTNIRSETCGCEQDIDCNDNNPCTDDKCDSLQCKYTTTGCDDGNQCTTDSCAIDTGCVNEVISGCDPGCLENADCDDLNPCTADTCDRSGEKGVCTYGPSTVTVCSDGNLCTENDTCVDSHCQGTLISCNDSDPCTIDSCDPAKGCLNIREDPDCGLCASAADCNDNNPCTTDTCGLDGNCAHAPISCNDNNPCTTDSCKALMNGDYFCSNVTAANDTPCDDGKICTVGDKCVSGTCISGTGNFCDDGDACTVDKCNASTGACTHGPVSCDDKNVCTGDVCKVSTAGTPYCSYPWAATGTLCNDNDICTVGDNCYRGKCSQSTGNYCDDGDACTVDYCAEDGTCTHGPVSCDDKRPCTIDSCKVSTSGTPYCVYTAVRDGTQCNDSDPCTVNEKCLARNCVGTAVDCNDNDDCTNDFCDPVAGCSHSILPGCTGCGSAADCDDLDPDTCDCCCDVSSSSVCVSAPNPIPGQPCNCALIAGCS